MDLAAMAAPGRFPFNILFQKVFQRQYYYERPPVVEMRGHHDWDRGNRDKCQKHGVSIAVIESLFRSPIAVFPDPEHSDREERFKAIGRAEDGRGVLIVFTLRCMKARP